MIEFFKKLFKRKTVRLCRLYEIDRITLDHLNSRIKDLSGQVRELLKENEKLVRRTKELAEQNKVLPDRAGSTCRWGWISSVHGANRRRES